LWHFTQFWIRIGATFFSKSGSSQKANVADKRKTEQKERRKKGLPRRTRRDAEEREKGMELGNSFIVEDISFFKFTSFLCFPLLLLRALRELCGSFLW
jgi:hypothetical protein